MKSAAHILGHYAFLIALVAAGVFCLHHGYDFAALCIFLLAVLVQDETKFTDDE